MKGKKVWTWLDGSEAEFTNWDFDQPSIKNADNPSCVALRRFRYETNSWNNKWDDIDCSNTRVHGICQLGCPKPEPKVDLEKLAAKLAALEK